MKQVIFSKFSNERADGFKIRTDILKDDDGLFYVQKAAMTEEAKNHIEKVYEWYKRLQPGYEKAGMKANKCNLSADKSYVDLEYLTGTTFQDVLDDLYNKADYQGLITEILKFADRMKLTGEQKPFEKTDDFVKVFGNVEFSDTKYGSDLNNIDLIFPNIIINDGWNIIDYEWTFDFPIPIDFIIYRAVHYYFASSKRSELPVEDVYEALKISETDRRTYQEMEHCFQLYILGETFGANNLYPLIAGHAYDLQHSVAMEKQIIEDRRIKIIFDRGEGLREDDFVWVNAVPDKEGVFEFPVTPDIASFKVILGEPKGVLHFKVISILGQPDTKLECDTNGIVLTESVYVFGKEQPYLEVKGFEQRQGYFHLEFFYEELDDISIDSLFYLVDRHRELIERGHQLLALQSGYDDLTKKYKEALKTVAEYEMLTNSAFWKFSKPQRAVIDGIKAFFHHHYWLMAGIKNAKRFISCKGLKGMREFNAREWELLKSHHVLNEISLVYDLREMKEQEEAAKNSPQDIKFSIIVPVFNTPELYLRKMIESVLTQTYGNFELCLADGSDKKHRYVEDICKEYRWHDKRIVYKKLKQNLGIAGNTNACLDMATGDYIVLFDHDDFLHPSALFRNYEAIKEKGADFLYSDEDTFHETIDDAYNPHHKPDFSPDYLRAVNYICHLTVFSRELYEKVGGFRSEFDGSQDYDIILRLTEQAKKIVHIPQVLYYWRAHEQSTAQDIHAKDYCMVSAKKALAEHLERVGLKGTVEDAAVLSWYRMRYEIEGNPKVSIIIPNKDHIDLLKRCIDSIEQVSTYQNFEIIVVENNSENQSTFDYYDSLKSDEKIKVVVWEDEFNYSAINNFGATFATGDYVLLLNNDMEVLAPDWLQEMLMFAQRDDVGAVGAKLYYPDDTIQHAGVILGIGGVAGHSHKYYKRGDHGYFARLQVAQNLSAVTAACMLMPKKVFDEVGGLDARYKVAFNDVDLCMRIRKAGYLIIYTPYAELYHYESVSRGSEDTPEKVARFNGEVQLFMENWGAELEAGDPYYNKNLSLIYEDFRVGE